MGYARTVEGAKKRVAIKREIRAAGIKIAPDLPTKELKKIRNLIRKSGV